MIPKRTLAVCACAVGAGSAATAALAADGREATDGPVIDALVPVVDEQLVPPSGQPTKRLQDRYLDLHKKARKSGEKAGRNVIRDGVKERDGDLRLASARDVKKSVRVLKRMTKKSESGGSTGGGAASPQLQAIANCESGGDPKAVGGGGLYRGKYQFSRETWAAVGGSGDPAAAPEAEQDKRAAQLLAQSGTGQWPVCGS